MAVTLQDVAEEAQVSIDRLGQVECTDSDLTVLAELCEPFRLVGSYLDLNDAQLEAIDGNYRKVEEKRLAVLKEWKQSRLKASYKLLAEGFLKCNRAKGALRVCEQFKKSHPDSGGRRELASHRPAASNPGSSGQHLNEKDHLGTVYAALRDARAKYYFIGLELGLDPNDLDNVQSQFRGDADESLRRVLQLFLRRASPPPMWSDLAKALESPGVGYGALAQKVRTEHT